MEKYLIDNIIKNNIETNNICYICLEPINYYYKFNCRCHIYIHNNCISDPIVEKCILCKKFNNNIQIECYYFDIILMNKIINILKISFINEFMIQLLESKYKLSLLIFIIYTFVLAYFFVLPIAIIILLYTQVKLFVNWIKKVYIRSLVY